jgi:nicotinamidase-related amidase
MEKQEKKIQVLILIDIQHDFISGSLANPEAQAAIPAILEKIKNFDGDAIFLTMDTHQKNYLQTPEGEKLPVEHCIYGTKGWEINEQVMDAVEARELLGMKVEYITKPTFGSVEPTLGSDKSLIELILDMELKATREDGEKIPMEIEICGFCTDICTISNALILKAYTYDFAEITVDSTCCAGVTPEKHNAALEVMKSCQINVI